MVGFVLVFCVVFIVLFVFVLCFVCQCCGFLWIVYSSLPLRFSQMFIIDVSHSFHTAGVYMLKARTAYCSLAPKFINSCFWWGPCCSIVLFLFLGCVFVLLAFVLCHLPKVVCVSCNRHRFEILGFMLFILSYYMFVLWCPLRYPYKTMFYTSLPPVVCRRVYVLYMLFVFVCAQWCQIRLDYMRNMLTLREHIGSTQFWWDSSFLSFSVCLCLVSCVPNVAGGSRLSIRDSPLGFSNVYLSCSLCTQCCKWI